MRPFQCPAAWNPVGDSHSRGLIFLSWNELTPSKEMIRTTQFKLFDQPKPGLGYFVTTANETHEIIMKSYYKA